MKISVVVLDLQLVPKDVVVVCAMSRSRTTRVVESREDTIQMMIPM